MGATDRPGSARWVAKFRERYRAVANQDGQRGPVTELDVHLRVAMKVLRHSKIAITMEITQKSRTPGHATRFGGWETASMADYYCTYCSTKNKEGRP
jgi:hypothetical protein